MRAEGPAANAANEAQLMSRRVRIFRADAFTRSPCTGNPACVVLDCEGLEERDLLAITREQGGVDTAFVFPPNTTDHDLFVRFFTPRSEASFVGHATVAVHAVRDALDLPACHRQKQRGSIVEIGRYDARHGRHYSFTQAPPPLHGPLTAERLRAVLDALGVETQELDPDCPSVVAGAGASRALIAVRSGTTLARLRPDLPRLAALSAAGNPAGYFIYSLAPAIANCDSEARMFCPALGIMEDPVSGNAHALLATQLHAWGRLPQQSGRMEFTSRQGHHMGRPGELSVRVEGDAERVRQVRVAGSARIVFEATLAL
jgi:PhzF family phenazine biosynthesis protein